MFLTLQLSDVSVLEEVLRMVLEILNSVLTHQLSHNHNLVYTLLYKRHLFQPFSTHPNFQDVTQNIDVVLAYLMGRLETTKRDPGVQDVQVCHVCIYDYAFLLVLIIIVYYHHHMLLLLFLFLPFSLNSNSYSSPFPLPSSSPFLLVIHKYLYLQPLSTFAISVPLQEVIQQGVLHLPKDRLKKFPELKFKYVEESEPEEFFIPYVWTLVYHGSGIYWRPDTISMFDPSQPDG